VFYNNLLSACSLILATKTNKDQLTRPLHAKLLLQHETEGIHTTKKN